MFELHALYHRVKLPVSYYPGMYRPNDPLDDDALSYTSTEVEDNSYTTVSYWKDREFFSNINLEGTGICSFR